MLEVATEPGASLVCRESGDHAGTNQVKNIDGGGSDVSYDDQGNVTSTAYRNLQTVEHDTLTGKTRRSSR